MYLILTVAIIDMYLVFAFDQYYPQGGGYDVVGKYSSFADACKKADSYKDEYMGMESDHYVHVLDTDILKVIYGWHISCRKPWEDSRIYDYKLWH